jgi:hypothetical protein
VFSLVMIVATVESVYSLPMELNRFGSPTWHVSAPNKQSPSVRNPTMAQWARVLMPLTSSSAAVSVIVDGLVSTLILLEAVSSVAPEIE